VCFIPRSSKDLEVRESCNVHDPKSLSTTKNLKYRPAPSGHDLDYKPKKYGSGRPHKVPISTLKDFLT
jgi:hypothetical protein